MQLVDATTGAHLWAETYNRPFQADAIFDLQDDLVPRIVSTVADGNGVLTRSLGDALRSRGVSNLTPDDLVLGVWAFYNRITAAEHAALRPIVERAVEQAKGYADLWALLAIIYSDEYRHGFNPRPDPLDRALDAARRAVDLAPSSHFAHYALASVLFFRRDLQAFRPIAERAVALNPPDCSCVAYMGALMAFTGDWTRGIALVERAIAINPHHPGWCWMPLFHHAYLQRDYAAALAAIVKVNMPGYVHAQVLLVAAHGQVGGEAAARDALRELLLMDPDVARTVRGQFDAWWFAEPDYVDHVMEGLRKGGLPVEAASGGA